MFDDLKRFETGSSQQFDWLNQLLDSFFPDRNTMDIRAVPRGSFPMVNIARSDDAVRVYVFALLFFFALRSTCLSCALRQP